MFLLGASIGSFLNAWAMRLPDESVLTPTRCRQCDKKLTFYELIPIFSWAFLGGKCFCKKNKISSFYFMTEILLGGLYAFFFLNFQIVEATFLCTFSSILLFCFLTDLYHKLLFLPMMLSGFVIGVCYDFYLNASINFSLTGMVVGYLMMWLIAKTYFLIKKSHGMGDGDKYLMGFIGAWVGWLKVIGVLFVSSWIGLLVAIFLMLKKRANLKTALPLGVFIVPAVPATLIFYKYIL
jgi:leader peptidase (prepilin peptidase)/N-methyltransferase